MHALRTDGRPGYPAPPGSAAPPSAGRGADREDVPGETGGATSGGSRGRWKAGLVAEARASRARTHRRRPVRPDRGSAVFKRRGLGCAPGPHLLQPGDQHRLDPVDVQVAALQLGPEVDDPQLGDLLPFRLPRGGRGCHGPGSGSHFGRAARCRGSEWAAGRRRRRRRQRRWRRWPRQHQLPTRARAASGAALRCAQ